jgi:hypothetical protein
MNMGTNISHRSPLKSLLVTLNLFSSKDFKCYINNYENSVNLSKFKSIFSF